MESVQVVYYDASYTGLHCQAWSYVAHGHWDHLEAQQRFT